jgi:crossover junction endodeoxyribonuclease RuvC
MKILGIDPGTKRMGYGLVEINDKKTFQAIDFDCFETKYKKEREILKDIFEKTLFLLKKHKPDLLSVEKIFFFKNQKTAFQISQARGVILLAACLQKVDVFEPTPLEVKTCLTGYGRADKKSVAIMVKKMLKLEKMPKLDDTTDALACAVTSFYLKKFKN